jgi:integrase
MALTAREVQEAKPKAKRYALHDGDGLILEILPSGSKIWRFRDQRGEREIKVTLGKYPYLSLQEAREKRHELKKAQINGIDIREALNPPKVPVFNEIADEWYMRNMEGKRNGRHLKDIRSMLTRYLLPALGARPVTEITAPELLQTLHRIQDLGYVVLTHKVKQVAGQVLQYAVLTGRAVHNVAADLKGALQPIRYKHHPSVTAPKDVAELMKKIDAYPTPIIRLVMLFSAYTFQRPGEIREAEWSEFDLDAAEWRIPAQRMKKEREHIVPLSRQVIEILRQAKYLNNNGGKYVFPSPFPSLSWDKERCLSSTAIRGALLAMGYEQGTMTAHGFRSLASTNLNAQGVDKELVEIQLSHRDEDHIRAAYNFADRLPDRKVMMQDWPDWLDSLYK